MDLNSYSLFSTEFRKHPFNLGCSNDVVREITEDSPEKIMDEFYDFYKCYGVVAHPCPPGIQSKKGLI